MGLMKVEGAILCLRIICGNFQGVQFSCHNAYRWPSSSALAQGAVTGIVGKGRGWCGHEFFPLGPGPCLGAPNILVCQPFRMVARAQLPAACLMSAAGEGAFKGISESPWLFPAESASQMEIKHLGRGESEAKRKITIIKYQVWGQVCCS